MPVLSTRTQVLIGIALALLLAITRGNHFATLNLPSASWAVFFLAGVLLRRVGYLPGCLPWPVVWISPCWLAAR